MQEAHFAAPFMGTGQCLDTLNRVLAALSPGHSFHDSLRELLAALAEDMHFDRPHIVVQDPESGELKLSLSYGPADAPEAAYEPGSGITGQVLPRAGPLLFHACRVGQTFRTAFLAAARKKWRGLHSSACRCASKMPTRRKLSAP